MIEKTETPVVNRRKSLQPLLPQHIKNSKHTGYDIYPYHSLGSGTIFKGYDSLASWMMGQESVLIDGYAGVFWEEIQRLLDIEFQKNGLNVKWHFPENYMEGSNTIQEMVNPFLGDSVSVWGTKTALHLKDFFNQGRLDNLEPDLTYDINIVIGVGSALLNWDAPVVYFDLPKCELQYRMRAGAVTNLGNDQVESPLAMYKRYYFVDWVVLNNHKQNILNRISILADAQWTDSVNWALSTPLYAGLEKMSKSVFRIKPWFEAGVWGGQWMKERIRGLNREEVNYAWSFEMIAPENGIVFESDGNLLELSFDFLMFNQYQSVLGKHADVFKTEFPIRFDFLDTWDGGNLSIQCHPSLQYIRNEFGENITQDETYYILDCTGDANVYLGFQDDINPAEFKKELENSQNFKQEIDITKYVQCHKAKKHDLFLIPNGTVHSAGTNNLVLEISATPYIFTFKMYDWLRLDLNGEPRPINIDHAFKNLNFERKGEKVTDELISRQTKIGEGEDWELIHVPTHQQHFYDVHRIEFDSKVTIETNNVCHVLMLVEGASILVQTADGTSTEFHYAETFAIPAAAQSYTVTNQGSSRAKLVKAFCKDEFHL
ncbi:MAG: class I mannose-6-phosphate isomerase [Pyrinomonadaceae bacterium]|nr:class I mannose-6-phosphate isomerase [Sphingobacteriaceae bacterium]